MDNKCYNDDAVKRTLEYLNIDSNKFDFQFVKSDRINGLKINKKGSKVEIVFSKKAYLFRALGLLKENILSDDLNISENAKFKTNGIMIDCSRNAVPKLDLLKKMIQQLALMGHNVIMLYTEDTYEVEGHPYFGYFRGRYSFEELHELNQYASDYDIELVPCIQTLGHYNKILKWSRVYGDIADNENNLLIGEEKTYSFIEDTVKACRKAFDSNRINIGMDEAHFMCRGKYYDINGDCDVLAAFTEHLKKVVSICQKYDFRPMLWGDMPMRLAGCVGYTDGDNSANPERFDEQLQKDVDLIYWDYYSKDEERYEKLIKMHKQVSKNIVFAGGAWRWSNFGSRMTHSYNVSKLALEKCLEHGIDEVFTTLWGDDGNESSFLSSWPIVQLYAEYGFSDILDEENLAKRFNTCTKGDWKSFFEIEKINQPCGILNSNDNFAKALLYQDPMLGLYDIYVEEKFKQYYSEQATVMRKCEKSCSEYGYIFKTLAALCDTLAVKCEISFLLKDKYEKNDTDCLKNIANVLIPELINKAEKFHNCFAEQWNKESKIFGYEVMDIRIGGLISRINSAKDRIKKYLDGEIGSLPELECQRILYNNSQKPECYMWSYIASTSSF